jgi:Flp pilus assembly protein TadG
MRSREERGAVTAFVVGFMLALLLLAGLVVDGGNVLAARREAANVAEAAARAGAQALDTRAARTSSGAPLDSDVAQTRAKNYLSQHGYQGSVSVQTNVVLVSVTITRPTWLLNLAGIANVTVHGRGESRGLRGIEREGD